MVLAAKPVPVRAQPASTSVAAGRSAPARPAGSPWATPPGRLSSVGSGGFGDLSSSGGLAPQASSLPAAVPASPADLAVPSDPAAFVGSAASLGAPFVGSAASLGAPAGLAATSAAPDAAVAASVAPAGLGAASVAPAGLGATSAAPDAAVAASVAPAGLGLVLTRGPVCLSALRRPARLLSRPVPLSRPLSPSRPAPRRPFRIRSPIRRVSVRSLPAWTRSRCSTAPPPHPLIQVSGPRHPTLSCRRCPLPPQRLAAPMGSIVPVPVPVPVPVLAGRSRVVRRSPGLIYCPAGRMT